MCIENGFIIEREPTKEEKTIPGIKKMIEENRYCGEVLVQVSAVESAVRSFGYLVLEDHMRTCVSEKIRAGDENIVRETVELIKKLN